LVIPTLRENKWRLFTGPVDDSFLFSRDCSSEFIDIWIKQEAFMDSWVFFSFLDLLVQYFLNSEA
jgi:hypothetical protein